ncbi:hypothetical protein ACOME3_004690 [Neoechinorhynchus agilis]
MFSSIILFSVRRCSALLPIAVRSSLRCSRVQVHHLNISRALATTTSDKSTSASRYEFRAETQKLLDIVAKSLYSEKEVFLRELISNASDALERRRIEEVKSGTFNSDRGPCINIETNVHNRTLALIDNGTGMTLSELQSNLGVIAKSGTKSFVDSDHNQTTENLIGQFGVGFYSSFMVASKVQVFTRSVQDRGYVWSSDGQAEYEIEEASEELPIGTRVVLYLRSDCTNFAKKDVIKSKSFFILRRRKNSMSF